MSETLAHSPEQAESNNLPEIHKSREFYTGDINQAVISAQHETGYNIDPTWWATEVGNEGSSEEIIDRFDKAYERTVWRANQVPEALITTIQSHEDDNSDPYETLKQVNGINIPTEILETEIDPETWAVEEQKRREKYVFSEAEFHLNRMFRIGDAAYIVDSISYTGSNGDYETLEIKIMNIESGKVSDYLDPTEVRQMIVDGEKTKDLIETENNQPESPPEVEPSAENPELARYIEKELEGFDQNAAFERAQFEAFLYEHPELFTKESSPEEEPQSQTPYSLPAQTPTIDAIEEPEDLTDEIIEQKRVDALEEFERLVIEHPELEELRHEYADDLENYLSELR